MMRKNEIVGKEHFLPFLFQDKSTPKIQVSVEYEKTNDAEYSCISRLNQDTEIRIVPKNNSANPDSSEEKAVKTDNDHPFPEQSVSSVDEILDAVYDEHIPEEECPYYAAALACGLLTGVFSGLPSIIKELNFDQIEPDNSLSEPAEKADGSEKVLDPAEKADGSEKVSDPAEKADNSEKVSDPAEKADNSEKVSDPAEKTGTGEKGEKITVELFKEEDLYKKSLIFAAQMDGFKGKKYKKALKYLIGRKIPHTAVCLHVPFANILGEEVELSAAPFLSGLVFSILSQFSGMLYYADEDGDFWEYPVPEYYLIGDSKEDKILLGILYWLFHASASVILQGQDMLEDRRIPGLFKGLFDEVTFHSDNIKGPTDFEEAEMHYSEWLGSISVRIREDGEQGMELFFFLREKMRHFCSDTFPVVLNNCLLRAAYMLCRIRQQSKKCGISDLMDLFTLDPETILPEDHRIFSNMCRLSADAFAAVNIGHAARDFLMKSEKKTKGNSKEKNKQKHKEKSRSKVKEKTKVKAKEKANGEKKRKVKEKTKGTIREEQKRDFVYTINAAGMGRFEMALTGGTGYVGRNIEVSLQSAGMCS